MDYVSKNNSEINNRQVNNDNIRTKNLNGGAEYLTPDKFVSIPQQNPRDVDNINNRYSTNTLAQGQPIRDASGAYNYSKVQQPNIPANLTKDVSNRMNESIKEPNRVVSDYSGQEAIQMQKVNDKSKAGDESKIDQKIVLGKTMVLRHYEKYGRFYGVVKQFNHPYYLIEYTGGDSEKVTHQQLLELLEKTNESMAQKGKFDESQTTKDIPNTNQIQDNCVNPSAADYANDPNYHHPHYRNQAHMYQQQVGYQSVHDERSRDYRDHGHYHQGHVHHAQQPRQDAEQGVEQGNSYKHEQNQSRPQQFDHEGEHPHESQDYSQQYFSYYQYQYPYQYPYQQPYRCAPQDQLNGAIENPENTGMPSNVYDAGEWHQYGHGMTSPKVSEENDDYYDKKNRKARKSSSKKRKSETSNPETPNGKRPRGRPRKIAIENPLVDCPLKKPLSAMKLFISTKVEELKSTQPKEKKQNLAPIAKQLWNELTGEEKAIWERKTKGLKDDYSQRLDFFLERRPDIREQLEVEKDLKKKVRAGYRRNAREKKRLEKDLAQHHPNQQQNYDSSVYSQTGHQMGMHDYGDHQSNQTPNMPSSNDPNQQMYPHVPQSNMPMYNEAYGSQQKKFSSEDNLDVKKQDGSQSQQQLSPSQYQGMYQNHYMTHGTSHPMNNQQIPTSQQQQQQQQQQYHQIHQRQHYSQQQFTTSGYQGAMPQDLKYRGYYPDQKQNSANNNSDDLEPDSESDSDIDSENDSEIEQAAC